jgi:hypothetical protein
LLYPPGARRELGNILPLTFNTYPFPVIVLPP